MAPFCIVLAAILFVILAVASLASLGHLWVIAGIALALFALGHLPI